MNAWWEWMKELDSVFISLTFGKYGRQKCFCRRTRRGGHNWGGSGKESDTRGGCYCKIASPKKKKKTCSRQNSTPYRLQEGQTGGRDHQKFVHKKCCSLPPSPPPPPNLFASWHKLWKDPFKGERREEEGRKPFLVFGGVVVAHSLFCVSWSQKQGLFLGIRCACLCAWEEENVDCRIR